jgi:hypothetical protein
MGSSTDLGCHYEAMPQLEGGNCKNPEFAVAQVSGLCRRLLSLYVHAMYDAAQVRPVCWPWQLRQDQGGHCKNADCAVASTGEVGSTLLLA